MSERGEIIDTLCGLASGERSVVEGLLGLHTEGPDDSGLDRRTHALVTIAALVAIHGPAPEYREQVRRALTGGATEQDVVGVLVAVAPHVGSSRVVAAAPVVMEALGLTPPEADPFPPGAGA